MIGSLRGTVLERSAEAEVLLEVHGVGYRVTVTPRTLATLDVGADAFLHVHHHIREDAQTLYGFTSRDERVCFEALLGAHRVGPALALAILGTHGPGELRRVVADNDVAALTLVPGVGKRTAERLLVELRARLELPAGDVTATGGAADARAAVRQALAGLGYGPDEIREAMAHVPDEGPVDDLLRAALQALAVSR